MTFENPTGARGAGGSAHGGRKGAPNRVLAPGSRTVIADIEGPGTIRHIWMTFPPAPPEQMRALWLEVFYDGNDQPSVSVPCLDLFGLPHGRPVPYSSALTSAQEGRGFNSYVPMPFGSHLRMEVTNSSPKPVSFFYQLDYALSPLRADDGYLHVTFRRENPTVQMRDFVICADLDGPGRFLGCNVGVRILDGPGWYGEGEVKMYRDGDDALPTICGTGLEDYVGSGWGLGPHAAPYAGAPLVVAPPGALPMMTKSEFVGFYRWHVPDPVVFTSSLRVTIQQIGFAMWGVGQEDAFASWSASHPAAGTGWSRAAGVSIAAGTHERADDYCATAFVYCAHPQPAPRLDIASATADLTRTANEHPGDLEQMFGAIEAASNPD